MTHIYRLMTIFSLIFFFIFIHSNIVLAKDHKLESLYIHTYIHEDGSATITENRKASLYEGTENYDIIENLGKSEIIDFTVSENGKTYEFVENWNINASQEEKAYKNGLIKTSNGYELAWGIGTYGDHEYTLKYTVTDFIKQLDDSQVLFWRFVNDELNTPPEKLLIEIETDKALHENDEKIWGFGFEGDIHFKDNKVIAQSQSPLSTDNYATVLIKFIDNQFQTEDVLNKTFNDIREDAFAGSNYTDEGKVTPPDQGIFNWLLIIILFIIFSPFIIFIISFIRTMIKYLKSIKRKAKYRNTYEREIPYDGSFSDVYKLILDMGMSNFENIISAFLLTWIKEGLIDIQQEETGRLFKSRTPYIYLRDKTIEKQGLEGELYAMILDAADQKTKLNHTQLIKWIQKNRKTVRTWEKDLKKNSSNILADAKVYKATERKFLFFTSERHILTDRGQQLKEELFKFSNYLCDYSLLNEHEAINVKLWDDLMIWAAALGITDEVYKEFKKLYPTYEKDSAYSRTSITATTFMTKSISQARSFSSSAGGGGSVSLGGGGGSFGGGSGGGTR